MAAAAAIAGCPTRFIGRVGDDATGERLVGGAGRRLGVDVRVQRAGTHGHGRRARRAGRRAHDAARSRRGASSWAPVDPAWLDGVTWLHVPAYSLCAEPIGASTLELDRRACRARGARLSVDVSSVGRRRGVRRRPVRRAARRAARPTSCSPTPPRRRSSAAWRPPLLVVKDGARPGRAAARRTGASRRWRSPPVDGVVDTTGAGDAFAGGFLAAMLGGAGPAPRPRAGAALAARTLTVAGAGWRRPE